MASFGDVVNLYSAINIVTTSYDKSTAKTLTGTATGFVVFNDEQTINYLVTNRHVVDPSYKKHASVMLESINLSGFYQPLNRSANPERFVANVDGLSLYFPDDPTIDLAIVSSEKVTWQHGDSKLQGYGAMSRAHISLLATTQEIDEHLYAGDYVATTGYPCLAGGTSSRPLLVAGVVASDPRFPAEIGDTESMTGNVLCHNFSIGGMSGSPVFSRMERMGQSRLVGVNAGHAKLPNSSSVLGDAGSPFSYFVRSDEVLKLLAAAGDQVARRMLGLP